MLARDALKRLRVLIRAPQFVHHVEFLTRIRLLLQAGIIISGSCFLLQLHCITPATLRVEERYEEEAAKYSHY